MGAWLLLIEKIGKPGFETISDPNETVLRLAGELTQSRDFVTAYEIGVGIGATSWPLAKCLAENGVLYLFSREEDVKELASDLRAEGVENVNDDWGSPNRTFSGYHFELAKGFVSGQLPALDLAYIDGGHVFHLDAPATCVLKELCSPVGFLVFDDWNWSLAKSPTFNPSVRDRTRFDYDVGQIEECHVQLVCKVLMDTDSRFEFFGFEGSTAIYRRIASHG